MIETQTASHQYFHDTAKEAPRHKVLKMVNHDRMAGSVPVWEDAASPADKVQERLSGATVNPAGGNFDSILDNVLTLQDPAQNVKDYPAQPSEEFGFGDLVDMINPLQHIPVAGAVYRELTGDEIKPISKLVGASLFGGPLGGATAMVNMVVEHETGGSVTEKAIAALTGRNDYASHEVSHDGPEKALNDVAALLEHPSGQFYDMPGSVMAYADLGASHYRAPVKEAVTQVAKQAVQYAHATRRYNE